MIYIVDEDVNQLRPFADELEIAGFAVSQIATADEALDTLSSEATPVALALIDVMLGARAGEGDGPFTLENTHNFTRTGIRLLELLRARRPGTFPERAVFFSMAASEELVAAITDVSDRQGVPYLRKDAYDTPYQFCLHIAEILHDLDG